MLYFTVNFNAGTLSFLPFARRDAGGRDDCFVFGVGLEDFLGPAIFPPPLPTLEVERLLFSGFLLCGVLSVSIISDSDLFKISTFNSSFDSLDLSSSFRVKSFSSPFWTGAVLVSSLGAGLVRKELWALDGLVRRYLRPIVILPGHFKTDSTFNV